MTALGCTCRLCSDVPPKQIAARWTRGPAVFRVEPGLLDLPRPDVCRGRHCNGNHEKRSA